MTYRIHANVADDFGRSPGCMFSYWLIHFPREIILDIGVFSEDQIEVSRNKVSLSFTKQETGIKEISSNCMIMVYWEIAEKKAGLRVKTKEKEEDNAACFD
jgi:hypothetical protein